MVLWSKLPRGGAATVLLMAAGLAVGGYRWRAKAAEARSRFLERRVSARTHELRERARTLDCLFGIAHLLARRDTPLEDVLRGTLALLPPAFEDPERVCARIVANGQEFKTGNYAQTLAQHSAAILVRGEPAGLVEVGYLGPRPEKHGEPFRAEDRRLIEAVAERMGEVVQRLQSEQLFHALSRAIEESTSAVLITDVDGNIEYVNQGFTSVTGYTAEEVLGQNPRLLKSGEQSPEFYGELWVTIRSGKPWRGEFINRKKNGELYWELATILPVQSLTGEVTQLVKVGENITERKRMDDALKIAHQFLRIVNRHSDMESLLQDFVVHTRTMTGCAAVGIRLLDTEGQTTHEVYEGFCPAFFQSECALAVTSGRCICPTDARGDADPRFPARSRGGSCHINSISRFLAALSEQDQLPACVDCSSFGYQSMAVVPIRLKERRLGCIVMADPSEDSIPMDTVETVEEAGSVLGAAIERLNAQMALQKREMTARALLDASTDLALLMEPDGTVVALNKPLASLWGLHIDELIGQNSLDYLPKEVAAATRASLETVRRSRQPLHLGEHRVDNRTFDSQMYPITDDDGSVVRVASYSRDITLIKKAEAELRQARNQLATLLALSGELVSTLELAPLLDLILAKLASVVQYDYACILTLTGDTLEVRAQHGYASPTDFPKLQIATDTFSVIGDMLKTKRPFYIADLGRNAAPGQPVDPITGLPSALIPPGSRAWLSAPLLVKNEMIGLLCLGHHQAHYYDRAALRIVQAFANEAAIAIANARLYRQAQELATAEERARLAHDLHDSVTQTLFSANLIANALPESLERDPDEARRNLEKLRRLTQGALAQMRSLLLEMRSSDQDEAQLGTLLANLSTAMDAQTGTGVDLKVDGECSLPANTQIALYRIAQEALNNISKHANASQVNIELSCGPDGALLSISDDGIGFDPGAVPANHLGLSIMAERAAKAGAIFGIESRIGQGTQITVIWQGPDEGPNDDRTKSAPRADR